MSKPPKQYPLTEKRPGSIAAMFDSIALRYDLANTVLSLGLHLLWRKELLLMAGSVSEQQVLDICCGSGDLLRQLAARVGKVPGEASFICGMDLSSEMLKLAKRKGKSATRVGLIQADIERMPVESESFNLVTIGFGLRNVFDLKAGLKEVQRVLKPDGRLLVLEFGSIAKPGWRWLFNLYSRYVMPIVGWLLTGNWEAYSYLDQSIRDFPAGQHFIPILEQSGFRECGYKVLVGGVAHLYWGKKLVCITHP